MKVYHGLSLHTYRLLGLLPPLDQWKDCSSSAAILSPDTPTHHVKNGEKARGNLSSLLRNALAGVSIHCTSFLSSMYNFNVNLLR